MGMKKLRRGDFLGRERGIMRRKWSEEITAAAVNSPQRFSRVHPVSVCDSAILRFSDSPIPVQYPSHCLKRAGATSPPLLILRATLCDNVLHVCTDMMSVGAWLKGFEFS